METRSIDLLKEIYQLSENISESQARVAVIMYNERRSGLNVEKMRSHRIEKLQASIDELTLERHGEILRHYSNAKVNRPRSLSMSRRKRSVSPSIKQQMKSPYLSRRPTKQYRRRTSKISSVPGEEINNTPHEDEGETEEDSKLLSEPVVSEEESNLPTEPIEPEEEESKWSKEPVGSEEKAYYEKCKQYYHITQMPLISISHEIFDDDIELTSASLVCAIDEDPDEFDEKRFLNEISRILNIHDIHITKIQKGCIKVVFEIFRSVGSTEKKIEIRAVYESMTDKLLHELGKLKILFMFMGDIKAYTDKQTFRNQITLHPEWNLIYDINHNYWNGALSDGRDRGTHPYYCPVGWQRYSFYVTDTFDEKFKGWSICYHGTKFTYGLSILLSGLAPADIVAHGAGIYATPSILYASHPRYAEVKQIDSKHEKTFFQKGKYVQFVLQCRVHPNNIKKIDRETLNASHTIIDPNISNDSIEWVIKANDNSIMDFNDPSSTIVCTGLMVRITDNHPGLLSESEWWFNSHLCSSTKCCWLGIDLDDLKKQKLNGDTCNILHE